MQTKNIFSLNLIAYLRMLGFEYQLETQRNTLFYAVFENDEELDKAIEHYKKNYTVQKFLDNFRELREEINTIRNEK